jgi:hypothetical protein
VIANRIIVTYIFFNKQKTQQFKKGENYEKTNIVSERCSRSAGQYYIVRRR